MSLPPLRLRRPARLDTTVTVDSRLIPILLASVGAADPRLVELPAT